MVERFFPVVCDAAGRESRVLRVHHAIYFVLLTVLVGSQVVSKFMMSGMQILLALNWLAEGVYIIASGRRGTRPAGNSRWLLFAFLLLMGIHLAWLIGTDNIAYGIDDIFRKLPLLAIPLVLLTSRPLNRWQRNWLMFFFVATVLVATVIGSVRLLTIPDLPYRDTVPFISHIRFSLNVCFAVVLLLWNAASTDGKLSTARRIVPLLLIAWLVFFLFVLRSYTAFFVIFVTLWLMVPIYWRRMGNGRRWVLAALVLATASFAATVGFYARSYFDTGSETAMLPERTACGNAYTHASDGLVENGHMVNNYVCSEELCRQWSTRSSMGIYDTTPNSYTVYPTLVRYLNAMGLTKDSAGVAALSDLDVERIEKGVANPVYDSGPDLKKMCYTLFFEYENYRHFGNIRNSSMLERLELWRGAWLVFCDNPVFGVGTGDGVDELHRRLQADGSQIADTQKHAHNQYLSFLVAFGLVGFALIAAAFVLAFRKMALRRFPALLAMVIIILLSFISEDTLETLAGCVLCTVIPCLLARTSSNHEPE
ncbi:MAG: O-antigen ligase family protein [Bacteroidales bacterium]|nr:O-antigen ligase family protein [Bacteroidales bacterium]